MGMFSGLGALETVHLAEGIAEIDYNMFFGCINLKNINIPSTVKHIRYASFAGTGLESIKLPSGLLTIEGFAFFRCRKLIDCTIPKSVTNLIATAFGKTPLFCSKDNSGMVRKDGWILGWDSKSKLDVHISKDNWRLFATGFLFASTAPLNVVVEPVPDSVSDEELLRELNGDSVISLTIRHPIKAIEYPIGGKNTESITLPDSVERISSMAFIGCRKLSSIRLPPDFLYDDGTFYKIFHESTNPMKTFLKDMAYAEEPTLQGAVLYFIYWYYEDVRNGKDVSDIQKYIRPLERFIEKIDNRHTVENDRKFKALNLIFLRQSLLCKDISTNFAFLRSSDKNSQVVKQWDSLDEEIKKR
jgi:hypothetical protein